MVYSGAPSETKDLAGKLAVSLNQRGWREGAAVIALVGNLGSGKTTFTQGFMKALGVNKRVLSPTFVVLKRFSLPPNSRYRNAYHVDAYRIKPKDLIGVGWQDALRGNNIILVEWADRIKSALPPNVTWVRFQHGRTENKRRITIN